MRPLRKKLLVAAVGVAAINYAACHEKPIQTGNLMAVPVTPTQDAGTVDVPPAPDAAPMVVSGNLMAPPPPPPPTSTVPPDVSHRIRSGNLMPPPPPPPPGTVKGPVAPVPPKK